MQHTPRGPHGVYGPSGWRSDSDCGRRRLSHWQSSLSLPVAGSGPGESKTPGGPAGPNLRTRAMSGRTIIIMIMPRYSDHWQLLRLSISNLLRDLQPSSAGAETDPAGSGQVTRHCDPCLSQGESEEEDSDGDETVTKRKI